MFQKNLDLNNKNITDQNMCGRAKVILKKILRAKVTVKKF